ncbi:Ferric_reduct domain-containing protein/FAD_binding_8 domain-containing protein/NAD_binding_6 domain-containing protein [Cephalotus follicularis]|uniref:ferric-chelate reductase (NADH) n=1 Tax=Cephalotus follicularis TaxID=3775 RepID=A0A1Q3DGZ1_CEPFO|nr:Ferric_reduct domain-containing protein/FAD_binding_8 domain-containing protein/NAD_binding_6 domain-containing protein [Cephalotus follicularis]
MESKAPNSCEGTNTIRAALKLTCMVVFMGYLMIWIMSPCDYYWNNWWPNILKIESTYFGVQGVFIFVYSFPILFIAALGCVYLHLGKKSYDNKFERNGQRDRFASWRRPMLVKGPLGIVSSIELALFVMFMALLVWLFSVDLHSKLNRVTPQVLAMRKETIWENRFYNASLMLGVVANTVIIFLFLFVTRGSSVLPVVFGLSSEGSIKYHIWLGHIVMVLSTAHGLGHIFCWVLTNKVYEMLNWEFQEAQTSNVAGELSLLAGLGLWATTFPRIRRKMFELFFYTHYLYILFMIFFVFHVNIRYAYVIHTGFYLFVVDRCLRFLQSRRSVRLISARILPCKTLELNFSKSTGLGYNPTSIMFINVPAISKLQWHPFTVTSNSNLEPLTMSVVVKSEGSWTKKLDQMLSSRPFLDRLEVSVEGPYGPASTHFLRHDTLVMVSGGSGITPFISIIRELIFASKTFECKTPKVILICSFKTSSDLAMLDLLLPISSTPSSTLSNLQLEIKAYVTREKGPTTDNANHPITILFKPLATDAPISAVLGPKSWLWLGAIISSSFIIFLIIIGSINRYYIYPIDQHNPNGKFSYPASAIQPALNILAAFVCIATTATVAVLWNNKQHAREANQVEDMEGTTKAEVSGADRELESLPQESIVQATKVHYGERPDLRKMILEYKGSSVGVLACGPKKLRHDVANICSSGLADNLYFESISFSW